MEYARLMRIYMPAYVRVRPDNHIWSDGRRSLIDFVLGKSELLFLQID